MFSNRFITLQVFFIIAAIALGALYLNQVKKTPLPTYGHVQDFKLINSLGQPVELKDLKGKVWVADFMFTTCSNICPMMTKNMGILRKAFAGNEHVRLVSVSVNPENDTPAALKDYASKNNADPKQWLFLTGTREAITKVAVESFKLGDVKEPIFHSSYFVLVDKEANIRGYYDGTDVANIKKIAKDLKQLL
jgi:protein SCO1/2